ncbi:MAG: hypothetical protein K2M46_01565 [Lachnospiraceae bacterium]|nr:hypothetical protein [Lachnospiraceae bacterium]
MDKTLLQYSIGGFVFVSIAGTLMHFAYEWTGKNGFVGLFAAVNESTWEHMKLLFFPMLFFEIYQYCKLWKKYPIILYGGLYATLVAAFAIPILFYGYQIITKKSITLLNLLVFYVSVGIGMILNYMWEDKCKSKRCQTLSVCLALLLTFGFWVFTYLPPNGILFQEP